MTNRTQRTAHAEVLLAQRHRAEHDTLTRRLGGVDQELLRLEGLITERNTELVRAASEAMREIIRTEIECLENQISERGNERQDILQAIAELRQGHDDHEGRLCTVETRTGALRGDVDGLQAHSDAHATAISRLEAANGWIPIIGALVTAFVTYFFIEMVEWLRGDRFTTQNQWFWAVLIGAIVGIVLTCLPGNGRSIITRSTASASGNVVVAPQPPADQPAQAAGVTPPPSPPPTGQFPTVQAAAAASASAS